MTKSPMGGPLAGTSRIPAVDRLRALSCTFRADDLSLGAARFIGLFSTANEHRSATMLRDLGPALLLSSCSPSPQPPDQDQRSVPRRPEISFSQGDKWNALMSTYIGAIPPSGE